ncbi:Tyrosine phosphatase family protein [Saccharopolyspora antimicrobica]|uniref:Tyrosine phosphatase family protein n=1 Tax=Saccharopolyspora antimicrobica TaxID=455193 RepID=A0A1I5HR18_9PSEU|nr:tyrosine-protein phosphatase [Saccharopolyspora antimicrobica]RKT82372.1 tyrosine phosphatase family protein [Saccharopolyspora antimicrobica]SFO50758.1 Tyrosine phosphatase family protein [Saccharopolyspora antimicrobica]
MSTTDPLDGLVNLRDLGGQPLGGGALTRSGVVYRSDAPHTGDRNPESMPSWPPSVVVDLRGSWETKDEEHPLAGVAEVHHVSLLEDLQDVEIEVDDAAHDLTKLYQTILQGAPKKLVEVFRIVLEADGPALIHCSAGKDRTGVSAALLLSAAGVRDDAIVADYSRTDQNMLRVLQRLDSAPVFPPGVDEEMVRELMSTPTEAIESVLETFAGYEDRAAGWLRTHGATEEELTRWRQKFNAQPA